MEAPACIDSAACFELLRTVHDGHVALSIAALPVVVPVRFALVDDDVLFGVPDEERLVAALNGNVVCLAVSCCMSEPCDAWTISITGTARVLPREGRSDADGPLVSGGPWGAAHLVRLSADLVTGRYFPS